MMGVFIFILGLLIGSFANVLIDRLPNGESIWWGRSHCDHCKQQLRWFELIPVVSFLLQGSRCRRCHKKFSVQYPIVELITAIGFVLLFPHSVSYYVLFIALLVIFVADLKYQIIPDSMIVIGCLAAIWTGIHLIPAICSFAFFFVLWLVTKKKGMGFGDVKFAFFMGLVLGFPGIVIALYIAFLTGAFVGVILMVGKNKTWKSAIAFGPFLVLGTVVALVWQPQLVALWNMYI
jgi:leader peptidase (prepilin peptidase)/N-methyltransferase